MGCVIVTWRLEGPPKRLHPPPQTPWYLHQIPFSEGAWGCSGVFGSYILGDAGFGVTLFPPGSSAVTPLHPRMEWAGMQRVLRVGDQGAPTPLLPPPGAGGVTCTPGRGVTGPCPPQVGNHVAQFSRVLVASLLFILSGTSVGDLYSCSGAGSKCGGVPRPGGGSPCRE